MRLFEMNPAPTKAGMARLQFSSRNGKANTPPPFREGEHVVLPEDREAEFFPLMNGEQFLFRNASDSRSRDTQYWFGGTDEQPFLVRLGDRPFPAFQQGGEVAFYASLKPDVVTKFEQAFGVVSRRQGDIFAVPVPHTWDEFRKASLLCCDSRREPQSVTYQSVFETRHKLKGLYAPSMPVLGQWHTLVEGVLKAPDHSPLTLKGPHLLVQAQNLFDPRLAD